MPTRTAVVDASDKLVYPVAHTLPQTFTAATRAAVAPTSAQQFAFETDTGIFYKATGTDAGDWAAVAGGLTTALSADESYIGFYNNGVFVGKVALSAGPL